MQRIDLEPDLLGGTMLCLVCGLPMYQQDHTSNYFQFQCRACGRKDQLDYEFTWETCKVNKRSILPNVKRQKGDTCDPVVMITILESKLKFRQADKHESFDEDLSIDDLVKQCEDNMGPGFSWDSVEYEKTEGKSRNTVCREVLEKNGVATANDYKSRKKDCPRYKATSVEKNASFSKSCKMIIRGTVLHAGIPITLDWEGLKGNDIYIADSSLVKIDSEGNPRYHAIGLVGFGRRSGENYYRFMNSHGVNFGDNGFGNVRAKDIKEVIRFDVL